MICVPPRKTRLLYDHMQKLAKKLSRDFEKAVSKFLSKPQDKLTVAMQFLNNHKRCMRRLHFRMESNYSCMPMTHSPTTDNRQSC